MSHSLASTNHNLQFQQCLAQIVQARLSHHPALGHSFDKAPKAAIMKSSSPLKSDRITGNP